jgi:myo-inositol 2-dehydrogenase/D-chiro-inositol 1-dehydrogenase
MIRYGFVGAGMMAQEHMRNIALIDGACVSAFADPDEGMRSSAAQLVPDAREFSDYKEMLSADLCDVYMVASPNYLHHAAMLDLLPTGKPILCEKPVCTTSTDARDLLRRSEGRAAPVWVAMEYRYMPPAQRLLAELRAGRVGTPQMFAIREHRFPFLTKVGGWNRFSTQTGGTMVEKCCHFWDLMRLVLESDPVRIYCSGAMDVNHQDETYDGRKPDIIDNAYAIVDFESGARGMLDLCMFAEGSYWQELLTVTGEKARIEARVPGPARFSADKKERHSEICISDRTTLREEVFEVEVDPSILQAGDHHGSTYYQHLKFIELVRSGHGTPEVSLRDGLWSVVVGEAAEESARSGQAIELKGRLA